MLVCVYLNIDVETNSERPEASKYLLKLSINSVYQGYVVDDNGYIDRSNISNNEDCTSSSFRITCYMDIFKGSL